ncbi:MAG: PhoPQ-activated protein PqaA family protein [Endozoicomonas sp.]
MKPWLYLNSLCPLVLALSGITSSAPIPPGASTATHLRDSPANCSASHLPKHLDQVLPCYLLEPDPTYQWQPGESTTVSRSVSGKPFTVRIHPIHLQSLRWKVAEQDNVNHPVWQHRLTIYQPERVDSVTALLYINGGTLYPPTPGAPVKKGSPDELDLAGMAASSKSVVIELMDIPNQFLRFGEGPPLKEDAIIAYTWKRFLQNPEKNYNWPLRLPMVKSTMRAMDTAQAFMRKQNIKLKDFVLTGTSKRGWTVWLTAAMDNRVSAIMPMVIDVLNLQVSMKHHYSSYRHWAPAVHNYLGLMPRLGSDELEKLMTVVDPFNYRHLLEQPKYIITASGDDFFLPDSSQFYFDDLRGDKWQRVLPDLRHYIVQMDRQLVTDTLLSFYGAFIEQRPMPEVRWVLQKGNVLKVQSSLPPKIARLHSAHNPQARDFRRSEDNPGVADFSSVPVTFKCSNGCRTKVELKEPREGWNAHFVELGFANAPYKDLIFTTRVVITPDVYPEEGK